MGWIKQVGMVTLLLSVLCSGCAVKDMVYPTNDEVLLYDLPLDLTFLRTYEAVESLSGWTVEFTEKESGIIQIRNINYDSFADDDKRLITVWVTRKARNQTAVQIAPESQHVIGGELLLKNVAAHLSRELT